MSVLISSAIRVDIIPWAPTRVLATLPFLGATTFHLFTTFPIEPRWVAKRRRIRFDSVRDRERDPARDRLAIGDGHPADLDRDRGLRLRNRDLARIAGDPRRKSPSGAAGGDRRPRGSDARRRHREPLASAARAARRVARAELRCPGTSRSCGSASFPWRWATGWCASSSSSSGSRRAPRRPTAPRPSRSPASSRS